MKNKIALASAFVAASSFSTAEIVINDFLSFEGFVDMSYTHTDLDEVSSDNSFAVDQAEISWLFNFDPVTAQIDLQHDENTDTATAMEQAFATYDLGGGGALTAGRYAAMSGFEAFEPTGLYQYSFAYDMGITGDVTVIPGYATGVKYTYETDETFFGISLQDEVFGNDGGRLGGSGDSSFGIEAVYAISFEDGLSWFLGAAYEEADAGDSYMLNTYLTYETGAWLFAGELNYGNSESGAFALGGADEDAVQLLVMANYAYSDAASITGRVSYVDHDDDVAGEFKASKWTLAHGYAFTDNLFLVNEISFVDAEVEMLQGAVELIFSF